ADGDDAPGDGDESRRVDPGAGGGGPARARRAHLRDDQRGRLARDPGLRSGRRREGRARGGRAPARGRAGAVPGHRQRDLRRRDGHAGAAQDPGPRAAAGGRPRAQSARPPDPPRGRRRRARGAGVARLRVAHRQRDPRRRRGGHHGMSRRETVTTIALGARERRLYDRLRAAVAAPPRPGRPPGPRDLLLLLPDLAVLLARLLRDPRVPRGGKAIALLGIGYVLSPIDLLPEGLLGPIGLVDDLFVV